MEHAEYDRFASMIMAVGQNYGREYTPAFIKMTWVSFRGYPFEQVARAYQTHIASERFAPTIADITQILTGGSEVRSIEAWGKLQDAIGTVGSYQGVVFDDPAIHGAVRALGGWVSVCEAKADEWLAKRFREAYDAIRADLDQRPERLHEHVPQIELWGRCRPTRVDGRWSVPVKLIGDREQLKTWTARHRRDGIDGSRVVALIEGVGQ